MKWIILKIPRKSEIKKRQNFGGHFMKKAADFRRHLNVVLVSGIPASLVVSYARRE